MTRTCLGKLNSKFAYEFSFIVSQICKLVHNYFFINLTVATSGVTYTRWGRTSCPNETEAQLVHSGRAGGTNYNVQGGSAEKFAYLKILTIIFLGQLTSLLHQLKQLKTWFRVLNFQVNYGVPGITYTTIMYHVQSVLFLSDLQPSWFRLKLRVHHPGPESTMAT